MSGYPGGDYPGAPGGGYPPAGGGYPGAPPVDPNVAQWFRAVDQDNSGQIDASELGQALANGDMSMFSEEACRMMISMFDTNNSNTIGMDEFGRLFNYINEWKRMFENYDREKQGTLSQEDLNQALQSMGYRYIAFILLAHWEQEQFLFRFSPQFVQNLLSKYSPRQRRLTLDNFIILSTQIKRLTDSFRTRDTAQNGTATLQYEDFVGLALGSHK